MDYFFKGEEQDYYVNKVIEEMNKLVPIVYRCGEDSEDGEAVVGCDSNGEIRFWITFDPKEREEMDKHIEKNTLLEYILSKDLINYIYEIIQDVNCHKNKEENF